MIKNKILKTFIESCGQNVYIEIAYPPKLPANAVIIGHGFRSYYLGFLNSFSKKLLKNGYITVKFHFVGTGKSDGVFDDKTTTNMLKNFHDVLEFVKEQKEIMNIGLVGRSNAGALFTLNGPDKRVKAISMLGSMAFYSKAMKQFVQSADIKNGYYYHKSFKRSHTKGFGRLPLSFIDDIKKYDNLLLENIKKMTDVIYFQSIQDETGNLVNGDYDYWKENLPKPKKMVLVNAKSHSYNGNKKLVIEESIKWFNKYLK